MVVLTTRESLTMQNKIIIETDEGFKAFEPHELPCGCLISYNSLDRENARECVILSSDFRDIFYSICVDRFAITDIKCHDIVDESGNSTNIKRGMTKDEENDAIVLDRPEVESCDNLIDIYAPFLSYGVVTEVWEKIQQA